jgi:predicted NUDIX family NTP pyrophosphohydrolase
VDIDGEYTSTVLLFRRKLVKASVKKVFPKSNGSVFANWYSGKLRIPTGSMTQYEHDDYNSRFEKEIIITIEKGKVLKMVTLDYTQQRLVVNLENIL